MSKIQILDCTLRDGGYVNNWEFGKEAIFEIRAALAEAGVKIAELGFLRDEPYRIDRSIYNSTAQITDIIGKKDSDMLYAGLIEMANYFPLEMLSDRSTGGPEAIRYSFWKRLIDNAYEYCEKIKEKGYLLCCQPTRVEQYSDAEFAELCHRFSKLEPYAVYIVDTFGLLRKEDLLRYAKIGHENLAPNIILGYHAHDNMGQAFLNACVFLEQDYGNRTIQIDASICGMGRGAGNLRLEAILEYLNMYHGGKYNLTPIYRMWDKYLSKIKEKLPWGFDLAYFITAANSCNPNYATYFLSQGMTAEKIQQAIMLIEGPDKYLYSDEKAAEYARLVLCDI